MLLEKRFGQIVWRQFLYIPTIFVQEPEKIKQLRFSEAKTARYDLKYKILYETAKI